MDNNKSEKEISYNGLLSELDELNKSSAKDINKIANIFGRIQDVKDIKNEEINTLFEKAIALSSDSSWEFLLEVYSRFYNRLKVKKQKIIVTLLENEVKKRISPFLDAGDLLCIINDYKNNSYSEVLDKKLDEFDGFCNEKKYSKQEAISYVYAVLLMEANKLSVDSYDIIIKIERRLFARFANSESNDPLFVKNIKKSLSNGKFAEKFKEITHLYDGIDVELTNLHTENESKTKAIYNKISEISELNDTVDKLSNDLEQKELLIDNQCSQIADLELALKKTKDLNEYNENLYKQQFISLKHNLVWSLKHDLSLEIEGLEDIADTLSDIQKEKIQRRIDRIYKIINKVEG